MDTSTTRQMLGTLSERASCRNQRLVDTWPKVSVSLPGSLLSFSARFPFCCPVIFLDGSDTAWSSVPRHGILTAQAPSTGLAAIGASMDRLVHPARLAFELMLVGFVSSLGWDGDGRPCAGRSGGTGKRSRSLYRFMTSFPFIFFAFLFGHDTTHTSP